MAAQMEFSEIIQTIKGVMRSRGVTYAILAKEIGLSESSVKKIFIGKDCSLRRVNAICAALDMRLVDVLSAIDERRVFDFKFTGKQQSFFLENEDYFHFYWKLVYERMTIDEIKEASGLRQAEISRYLRKLDQLKLLEWHPHDVVKLPRIRPIRWHSSGVFMQEIRKKWSSQMIQDAMVSPSAQSLFTLQYVQLSRKSFEEMLVALRNLEEEFAKRTARDLAVNRRPEMRARFMMAVVPGSFVDTSASQS